MPWKESRRSSRDYLIDVDGIVDHGDHRVLADAPKMHDDAAGAQRCSQAIAAVSASASPVRPSDTRDVETVAIEILRCARLYAATNAVPR